MPYESAQRSIMPEGTKEWLEIALAANIPWQTDNTQCRGFDCEVSRISKNYAYTELTESRKCVCCFNVNTFDNIYTQYTMLQKLSVRV